MAQPIWNTNAGSLGTYPSLIPVNITLLSTAVPPAVSISYKLISGSLPPGLSLSSNGIISGTPFIVTEGRTNTFTIRATDNLQNLRDRTFSITVTGSASPSFVTTEGNILQTIDSVWIELPIQYSNPDPNNKVIITQNQGSLPPGLEINEDGLIRGYPEAPTVNVTLSNITTTATNTSANIITCFSTIGFTPGRPVTFSGTLFGGLELGVTYFVKTILSTTGFTVSTTQFGPELTLTSGSGSIIVTLPSISVGQPAVRTYTFGLQLSSSMGSDSALYSITVINQNAPSSQGGPNNPPNTRVPVILNTRPTTLTISQDDPYYGYYLLPEQGTYAPSTPAPMGNFESDNYFAFKIIGKDFDNDDIKYSFNNLTNGLVGDVNTGWITGTPLLSLKNISSFTFSVSVYKTGNPNLRSDFFNFTYNLQKDITNKVTWLTDTDLGNIFNGTVSIKSVVAVADTELEYRLINGSLPPNLSLSTNGEIVGCVANQPTTTLLSLGDTTTFNFTVQAFSPLYPVITSTKSFTLTIVQEFEEVTDTLYIKATPSIEDRLLVNSLLSNEEIIPTNMLYRPNDLYFGKAKNVIYEHAYGIYASNIGEYLAAVTKNHYWRNITLGEIETAVARNEAGEIIYEVVYSKVIDNLVNPQGVSVSSVIGCPTPEDEDSGPWYTSVTSVYTSYQSIDDQDYYTSLTPGNVSGPWYTSATNVFTSYELIDNQEYYTSLVPIPIGNNKVECPTLIDLNLGPWYTSVTNIFTSYELIGDQEYYTSLTPGSVTTLYPNSLYNMRNRVGKVLGQEYDSRLLPLWMTSQQKDGSTLGYTQAWVICYTKPGFSEIIKKNIETQWVDYLGRVNKLNYINFEIDRFSVDKSITYNYNTITNGWLSLPSAIPAPNPLDSKDFYVLFPRKTILPDRTQY